MGSEEIDVVSSIIKDGQLSSNTGGKHVKRFEKSISSYLGIKYAVAVNSGTAALQSALYALDIQKGDEVLIPSFSFIATANAVTSTGARPVFVDITRDNYTMDPNDLEKKITKKTKAVIPVHLYGNVAFIDQISDIAKRNDLSLIEDSAQSLGSTIHGRQTGTLSDMGCFSMYPTKVMTSGEGGFVVTDNRDLRDKLLLIRNHGMENHTPKTFGLNLRLPEINAAIAKIQMKKLPKFLKKRRQNANYLTEIISDLDIQTPKERRGEKVNWYLYTISLLDRDRILKKLNQKRIDATAYYSLPIHKTAFYKRNIKLHVTNWAADHVLSLPIHPKVSMTDIEYISRTIHNICE